MVRDETKAYLEYSRLVAKGPNADMERGDFITLRDGDIPEPPDTYILLLDLENWNCLPLAGGYLNQPTCMMQELDSARLGRNDYKQIEIANKILQSRKGKP